MCIRDRYCSYVVRQWTILSECALADRFRPTAGFCRDNALRTPASGVGQARRFDLLLALDLQFAEVDRLAARLNATARSPAALMMSIDIQIAIWLVFSEAITIEQVLAHNRQLFWNEPGGIHHSRLSMLQLWLHYPPNSQQAAAPLRPHGLPANLLYKQRVLGLK